ncbi:AfsR/SARP family transcriptional regulator [Dactylosporangium sp. CA-139066]|uniref:AfsR/SARP family transcriptional regulator n=1 Tax=Dactylosporangium sp. CA-139066 TaxID=3239930 RepID=UPI003D8CDFFF
MNFVILGPTALRVDGQSIPLGAAKQRGMLALLLYHAGEPVRVDTIVEHLWNRQDRAARRASLYSMISRTRAALGRAGLGETLLRTPGTGAYRLDIDPGLVDFHRFQLLVVQGRDAAQRHRYDAAVEALGNAMRLWRDEPLADLRTVRADDLRRHMNTALLDAQKLLAVNRLRLGQHHRALAEIEPLMRANDLDETLAQLWVTALSGAGREQEARSFLRNFRRHFRQHLRAEPAVELPRSVRAKDRVGAPAAQVEESGCTAPPQELPKDIGDFVGHEQLLAEIGTLTAPESATTNVVAISGMPGVGKTTLAVHWAYRQRHRFPDGNLYLNAHAYGPTAAVDPEDALGRFLSALDVPPDRMPTGLEQRRSRYNQLLADRRMLILLDDVRDANQARPLIPTAAGCVTLITSRTRLRGLSVRDGIPSITVQPLPETDGLTLLLRTIGDARARAEPDAVGALARLSAGLPLALRIIGEHIAERPRAALVDLAGELTSQLFSTGGEDDEAASLQTVFAWSYRALAPDIARLFRLLGLQPGPTLGPESAAALLGTDAVHAEQQLNSLARMYLINHDTARRYRLHDLLRRFAADRAAEEDSEDTRTAALRRLLDWSVLSGANALTMLVPDREAVPDLPAPVGVTPRTFATDGEAMAWCESERENLSAASLWAARHGFDRHAWQLPQVLLETLQRRGHLEEALPLLETAYAAAERDGSKIAQVGTLNNLGVMYLALHDYPNAVATLDKALQLARRFGDVEKETMCLHNLASVHLSSGDAALAARLHGSVLAACRAAGNAMGEASARHKLGDDLRHMGQYSDATTHYTAALDIRERMGSLRGQGTVHAALAALHLETGELVRALAHGERALDFHSQARDDPGLCDALITVADIRRRLGSMDGAIHDADRATSLSADLADSRRRCHALTALADALAAAGDHTRARATCAEALTILNEINDPRLRPVGDRLRAICRAAVPTGP